MRPCNVCGSPAIVLIAPTIASARYLCLPCAIETLNDFNEHKPQGPAPEADREEAEEPLVGEAPAGEPGVQPATPLLEPTEE